MSTKDDDVLRMSDAYSAMSGIKTARGKQAAIRWLVARLEVEIAQQYQDEADDRAEKKYLEGGSNDHADERG